MNTNTIFRNSISFAWPLLALFLALGACGSDDEDGPKAGPGTGGTGGTGGAGGEAGSGGGGAGTGGSSAGGSGGSTATWECDENHDGWERCEGDKIQYCHFVAGEDPHFHWGADCQALGYACHDDGQGEATCLDTSRACSEGEFWCENNTAYNCIDGYLGVKPCGTAKHCHEEEVEAHCEEEGDEECGGHGHLDGNECHCDEGYVVDPEDPMNCIPA